MTESEAIEVLTDRHTSIGTTKCDDVSWRKLKPAIDIAVNALEEIQQYQAIGTVEECREARERQRSNKLILNENEEKGVKRMAEKNCELELYKLIMEGANCGFPYVSEFGWINDVQFIVWVDYLWIKEFMDKIIEIFGDGIFEDCRHFHAIMQSHAICIDLMDLLDGFVDIEEVFPKEDYKH